MRIRLLILFLIGSPILLSADTNQWQQWVDREQWKKLQATLRPALEGTADGDVYYYAAQVEAAFGNLQKAIALAEKAVKLKPKSGPAHFLLSKLVGELASKSALLAQMNLGRRFKSELDLSLELDSKNPEAQYILMLYYQQAPSLVGGDAKKAHGIATQLLKNDPVWGHLALADLAIQNKKFTEAEQQIKKGLAAAPQSYRMLTNGVDFYIQKKEWKQAQEFASQAIQIDPAMSNAYESSATALVHLGKRNELVRVLGEVEKNIPHNLAAFYRAASAFFEQKDYASAEPLVRKYLSQPPEGYEPSLAEGHFLLGQILEKLGHDSQAIRELEAAVKLDPSLAEARRLLRKLKQ